MKKITIVILFFMSIFAFPVHKVHGEIFEGLESKDLYKNQEAAVQVFTHEEKSVYVTDEDVYLMAQIVYAESRSEPYDGKVAVASVILNRLSHPQFPKTIEKVVKQKGAFSCVNQGQIGVVPDEESYAAVLDALQGKDPTEKAVFFYNPKIATSSWMINIGKKNSKAIGNHVFFIVP